MSQPQEEFLLKWNDHHNSFFAIMQDLCQSEFLTDVTLACGGQIFETHKLMLCVCSPFFKSLLSKRPDRHPIVFLKNVDPKHLAQLLQYMYHGEINVLQDDLGPLVETAKELQIKGLADAPSPPPPSVQTQSSLPSHPSFNSDKDTHHSKSGKPRMPSLPSLIKSSKESLLNHRQPPPPLHSFGQIPKEPLPPESIKKEELWAGVPSSNEQDDDEEYGEVYQDQGESQGIMEHDDMDGIAQPQAPPDQQQQQQQQHHHGTHTRHKYHCSECGKGFVTPSKLQRHSYSHTGLRPYPCYVCGKSFSQAANLKTHLRNTHGGGENLQESGEEGVGGGGMDSSGLHRP